MIRYVLRICWILLVGRPLPVWLSDRVIPGQWWTVAGVVDPVLILSDPLLGRVKYAVFTRGGSPVAVEASLADFLAMATLSTDPQVPSGLHGAIPADAQAGELSLLPKDAS